MRGVFIAPPYRLYPSYTRLQCLRAHDTWKPRRTRPWSPIATLKQDTITCTRWLHTHPASMFSSSGVSLHPQDALEKEIFEEEEEFDDILSKQQTHEYKARYRDLWICRPGMERVLSSVLHKHCQDIECDPRQGYVETTSLTEIEWDPPFVLQRVPNYREFKIGTTHRIAEICNFIEASIADLSKDRTRRWDMHSLPKKLQHVLAGTAKHIITHLKNKHGKLMQRKVRTDRGYTLKEGEILIQLYIRRPGAVVVSIRTVEIGGYGYTFPLPWLNGLAKVEKESKAPAQSYKKIKEILTHMRLGPKELEGAKCVELGSHPGGWTYVLLNLGCRMITVDWAKQTDPLIYEHPNFIRHFEEDARIFHENISGPLTMVLCDAALPPRVSLAVMQCWLEKPELQMLVWVLKFRYRNPELDKEQKGDQRVSIVSGAQKTLEQYSNEWEFTMRSIYKQGNELTIMAKRIKSPSTDVQPEQKANSRVSKTTTKKKKKSLRTATGKKRAVPKKVTKRRKIES